jgi:hypothetical protein
MELMHRGCRDYIHTCDDINVIGNACILVLDLLLLRQPIRSVVYNYWASRRCVRTHFFRESDLSPETKILAEISHLALRNPQKLWRHPLNRKSPTQNAWVRVPPLEWDTVIRITVRGGDVIGWLGIDVLSTSWVTIGFVVVDLIY